jgi:hypothetical protein
MLNICNQYIDISFAATESYVCSSPREASNVIFELTPVSILLIQRTNRSIIAGTERRESHETNSHRLSNKPDSSSQYSNNHKDDPTSTRPGKRHIEYANIKLREKSFKTWPLNIPTIVQLAEAGFFHSGKMY